MNHFLNISDLSREQIEAIIQQAMLFKQQSEYPIYAERSVANLFYENSTRTRVSFELAAKHLSMQVINFDVKQSSENKGEILTDTIKTLQAMGIHYFVIRHKQEYLPHDLASFLGNSAHIINAGDGTHAHPSQAILDIMTIMEQKPRLDRLKIAILGNIRHSRVARSFQSIAATLGIGELVLISPKIWQPDVAVYGTVTDNLKEGLADADVIICLRVQQERLADAERIDLEYYRQHFALTNQTLCYAKPDALVLHPGPINREVEIDSDVADGTQSCILNQVTNGVFVRMAIFHSLSS